MQRNVANTMNSAWYGRRQNKPPTNTEYLVTEELTTMHNRYNDLKDKCNKVKLENQQLREHIQILMNNNSPQSAGAKKKQSVKRKFASKKKPVKK